MGHIGTRQCRMPSKRTQWPFPVHLHLSVAVGCRHGAVTCREQSGGVATHSVVGVMFCESVSSDPAASKLRCR